MTDHISNVLKIAANVMNQRQTLPDLHQQFQAYALANMLNDKQDHDGAAMLACGMSRAVWRSMPNPSRQFQTEKLPDLGRNDPCAIGLGCKHKQCCGRGPGFPSIAAEHCWAMLCEVLPANRMHDILDSGRLPDGMLSLVAARLLEIDPDRVRALLEPHFANKLNPKDKHAAELLLTLCDAYDELGQPETKMTLLERVAKEGGGQVRADALQRLATVHSDRGDFATSWKLFGEAQRVAPDDPALAHLEVMLLISQKRDTDAQMRARFWTAKFDRAGYDDESMPLLSWLRQIGQGHDPVRATAELTADRLGEWEKRMIAAVETGLAKPVQNRHLSVVALAGMEPPEPEDMEAALVKTLTGMGVSKKEATQQARALAAEIAAGEAKQSAEAQAGLLDDAPATESNNEHVLVTDAAMQAREQAWHRAWPLSKPISTQPLPNNTIDAWSSPQVEFWVEFLEQYADAMNSLDILDDLLVALSVMPDRNTRWATAPLREKIFKRVEALLAAVTTPELVLPWMCEENRPALRLLVQDAFDHMDRNAVDTLPRLQAVLRLNPNDNHGLRDLVVNRHLENGDDKDALAAIAKYPDDIAPALCFGKVLALYRLGELPLATAALKAANQQNRKIVKFLLPANNAQPKSSAYGVEVGGDDEAWLYRRDMREVWQSVPGAMAWLKRLAG